MTANDYLDALVTRYRWNDSENARQLGISRQAISNYRHDISRGFDTEVSIRVAELLDLDPMTIVADMNAVRSKSAKERKFWKGYGSAAAVATVALPLAAIIQGAEQAKNALFCILC